MCVCVYVCVCVSVYCNTESIQMPLLCPKPWAPPFLLLLLWHGRYRFPYTYPPPYFSCDLVNLPCITKVPEYIYIYINDTWRKSYQCYSSTHKLISADIVTWKCQWLYIITITVKSLLALNLQKTLWNNSDSNYYYTVTGIQIMYNFKIYCKK